jgi:hypothetical protein
MSEPLGDELDAFLIILAVQDAHVRWLGAQVDACFLTIRGRFEAFPSIPPDNPFI